MLVKKKGTAHLLLAFLYTFTDTWPKCLKFEMQVQTVLVFHEGTILKTSA